jgi:tRNA-2-methylthio-N6-dimethylallyladenosine synthase
VINLMGCLVGIRNAEALKKRFPYVDVFSPPSDPAPLVAFLTQSEVRAMEESATANRFAVMDGDLVLPEAQRNQLVSGFIPIVYGCSHACTFCIIPYRRGIERSRPPGDILAEARAMVRQGDESCSGRSWTATARTSRISLTWRGC